MPVNSAPSRDTTGEGRKKKKKNKKKGHGTALASLADTKIVAPLPSSKGDRILRKELARPREKAEPVPPPAEQTIPPPDPQGMWAQVVGRKESHRTKRGVVRVPPALVPRTNAKAPSKAGERGYKKKVVPKPPKTAAVTVTYPEGEQARSKINLAELVISALKARKGLKGALVLAVPGAGATAKADALVARLR